MKILSGLIILIFPGLVIYGQQVRTATPPTPPSAPKVIAEIAASSERAIKGAPFSAEAVSESVQTLADGNRIVRKWTDKLYRSSDGRFRREGSGVPGSAFGSFIMADPGVTILDPVGGARYTLNTDSKTARTFSLRVPAPVIVGTRKAGEPIILNGVEDGVQVATTIAPVAVEKFKTEINAEQAVEVRAMAAAKIAGAAGPAGIGSLSPKWERRTEDLGTQNFEGVDAVGTRTTTTIPADAIGNERPIEIVYERWYSNELQIVVYSKHYDPRFGEQTYRLTNINRSEPDPSLFQVPNSYRMLNEFQYKTSAGPRATVERVVTTRSSPPSRP